MSQAELRNQALGEAMGNARTQAETLAASENLEITTVRSISAGGDGPRPLVREDVAAVGAGGTEIQGGQSPSAPRFR